MCVSGNVLLCIVSVACINRVDVSRLCCDNEPDNELKTINTCYLVICKLLYKTPRITFMSQQPPSNNEPCHPVNRGTVNGSLTVNAIYFSTVGI